MSRFPPVQHYFGWLQRFLYQIESGELPFPTPAVDVSWDWPQEHRILSRDYATIAGTVTTPFYQPAEGRHGLVWASSIEVGAGIAANDSVSLRLDRGGLTPSVNLTRFDSNGALIHMPLIGGLAVNVTSGMFIRGIDPVYVPNGMTLNVIHSSAAGGQSVSGRAVVIDLPSFQPLRLP